MLTVGCGGARGEDPSAVPWELCRWLTAPLPDGACVSDDPWLSLAARQTGRPALDLNSLNVVVSGADPVTVAAQQSALGFLALGRSDPPRWPLVLPLNWNADPFKDSNWRFQLNAWRFIDPLILAWKQTGEPAYIDESLRLIADWHRFHIEERRPSPYGWGDMATGIRAMKLGWFLDSALRGEIALDAAHRSLLFELAHRRARMLREEDFLADGNHGLFQMHGLLALCRTLPYVESCTGAAAYAEGAMQKLLTLQFTDEGVHREHSPSYHMFVADTLRRMLRSGWYDDFEFVRRSMSRVDANRVWMYHRGRQGGDGRRQRSGKHSLPLPDR